MDGRAERSVDDLLREADEVASGDLAPAAFAADLDWALPAISRAGGEYAPQVVAMIGDATDELAVGRAELTPEAARALAASAALAAREGARPETVATVHERLVAAGLRPAGPPPEPRPSRLIHPQPAASRPRIAGGAEEPGPPADPAIDPEVTRLTRRVAPGGSSLQPLRVLGLGWAIVLSLVVGLLGGLWLDGQFGTSPILTLVGLGLGLLLAAQTARQLIEETRRT
ncbi:MAG TPA: AtpZ/AtpI family protein [Chloroflexota bacterium]|jgi:hypothetical protein|nr:AtpZ/AtpI family protein [Chloroflexota bacterium]